MNRIKVTVSHTYEEPSSSLPGFKMPYKLLKRLKIPVATPIRLLFSNQTYQVRCYGNNAKGHFISMSKDLANKLHVPDQAQISISYSPHKAELQMGPVFAVLVISRSRSAPPFGGLNKFLKEIMYIARSRHILAYVVTLQDLLEDKETVRGTCFINNRWKTREFPYPQVIYNRLGSRKLERSESFNTLKSLLEKRNISFFNHTFLNKWEVHQALKNNKQMSSLLPDTQLYEGPFSLKTMLEKHHILFIKPINGALGKGIYRLKKTSQGISSQYSTISGQMHRHFNKLSELYTWLNKRLTKQNFVLQEGISILSYRGRAIDFRALMQKNSNGVWSATSTVARIGPVNRFVSNVARGGGMSAVLPILRRCRVSQPSLKRSSLLATAKKICEEIDKSLAGDFGELGVDLAMNKAGRIYLLEVNSKPSKNDKSIGSLSQNKGRPSAHRLLDYAGYLIDEKKGKKEL